MYKKVITVLLFMCIIVTTFKIVEYKSKNEIKITETEFMDNEGNMSINFYYPVISGLETYEKDFRINKLIKNDILKLVYDDPLYNEKRLLFVFFKRLNFQTIIL